MTNSGYTTDLLAIHVNDQALYDSNALSDVFIVMDYYPLNLLALINLGYPVEAE